MTARPPANTECPGSRAYLPRNNVALPSEAEPVERGGEFNLPTRARCPSCQRVYAVVGPGTYLHIRKHRMPR